MSGDDDPKFNLNVNVIPDQEKYNRAWLEYNVHRINILFSLRGVMERMDAPRFQNESDEAVIKMILNHTKTVVFERLLQISDEQWFRICRKINQGKIDKNTLKKYTQPLVEPISPDTTRVSILTDLVIGILKKEENQEMLTIYKNDLSNCVDKNVDVFNPNTANLEIKRIRMESKVGVIMHALQYLDMLRAHTVYYPSGFNKEVSAGMRLLLIGSIVFIDAVLKTLESMMKSNCLHAFPRSFDRVCWHRTEGVSIFIFIIKHLLGFGEAQNETGSNLSRILDYAVDNNMQNVIDFLPCFVSYLKLVVPHNPYVFIFRRTFSDFPGNEFGHRFKSLDTNQYTKTSAGDEIMDGIIKDKRNDIANLMFEIISVLSPLALRDFAITIRILKNQYPSRFNLERIMKSLLDNESATVANKFPNHSLLPYIENNDRKNYFYTADKNYKYTGHKGEEWNLSIFDPVDSMNALIESGTIRLTKREDVLIYVSPIWTSLDKEVFFRLWYPEKINKILQSANGASSLLLDTEVDILNNGKDILTYRLNIMKGFNKKREESKDKEIDFYETMDRDKLLFYSKSATRNCGHLFDRVYSTVFRLVDFEKDIRLTDLMRVRKSSLPAEIKDLFSDSRLMKVVNNETVVSFSTDNRFHFEKQMDIDGKYTNMRDLTLSFPARLENIFGKEKADSLINGVLINDLLSIMASVRMVYPDIPQTLNVSSAVDLLDRLIDGRFKLVTDCVHQPKDTDTRLFCNMPRITRKSMGELVTRYNNFISQMECADDSNNMCFIYRYLSFETTLFSSVYNVTSLPTGLIKNGSSEIGANDFPGEKFDILLSTYIVAHQHLGKYPPILGEKYKFSTIYPTSYLFSLPTGSPIPDSMKLALFGADFAMQLKYQFAWWRYGIDFPLNEDRPTYDALMRYYTQKTGHSLHIYEPKT